MRKERSELPTADMALSQEYLYADDRAISVAEGTGMLTKWAESSSYDAKAVGMLKVSHFARPSAVSLIEPRQTYKALLSASRTQISLTTGERESVTGTRYQRDRKAASSIECGARCGTAVLHAAHFSKKMQCRTHSYPSPYNSCSWPGIRHKMLYALLCFSVSATSERVEAGDVSHELPETSPSSPDCERRPEGHPGSTAKQPVMIDAVCSPQTKRSSKPLNAPR